MEDMAQNERQGLLPLYVCGANMSHEQEPVDRPQGYPNCQLTLCREGSGIFTDEKGQTHKIERGDLFFFAGNVPQSYKAVSDVWMVSYIVFNGTAVNNILDFFGLGKSFVVKGISETEFNTINMYFNKIFELLFSTIDTKTARCSGLLYTLFIYVSEMVRDVTVDNSDILSTKFAPVVNYIYRHTGEDISLTQLEEVMGVTESRLTHLFKRVYNISPMQAVRKLKINYAKNLLKIYPNKRVREIAEECGFSSTEYFVTVFKRETGMSPTEFRKTDNGMIPW